MYKLTYKDWKKYLIIEGYRDSHAHGTYVPNSNPVSIDDIDIIGIAVLPKEYYLGFSSYLKENEQYEKMCEGKAKKL